MNPKRLTFLVALVSCATACTVGPNFTPPPAPDESVYSQSLPPSGGPTGVIYGADMADDWYTLFHSNALNTLVHQALANNPDLSAARHGLVAAQYELKAVSGAALPQIDGSGKVERAHANGSFLYGPVNQLDVTAYQFSAGPSLAYNLDLFGGVRRSIEAQRAQTAGVREQVLDTYVTLVDQVVITAFDYAASCAQIEVTRSLVKELRDQFDLTSKLEQAGKTTRSDTLEAQSQLEVTAATLPALEQQRDTYRNALAQLTASNPDDFRMPDLSLRDFDLPDDVPVSLPSALVRHRPDILAAEDQLHQSSASIGVAEAARFPSITLSAQYAQQTSFVNEFLTRPGGIWSLGADLAAPIYHGGTLAAREKEAREQYLQAQDTYRKTVVGAFVEVANALQSLGHDRDGYLAHTRALDAARANSDLSEAQYRAGRYTELQVLTAQQQFQQAALSQVQSDAQRFTDIASLFRALGGGWWNAQADPAALPVAAAQPTPAAPEAAAPHQGELR
ncbi:MAG TPA: efflux transporter outer membrane subunit [Steroidobacteraceae bacterium]|jgi:NodT family efflux transporter outer membrane factor (OMF) lipoprotein|nr:efflux transporter outer membrane subunit [Steroidobacteraceae bacterium]